VSGRVFTGVLPAQAETWGIKVSDVEIRTVAGSISVPIERQWPRSS
jgi:hypothetical protein